MSTLLLLRVAIDTYKEIIAPLNIVDDDAITAPREFVLCGQAFAQFGKKEGIAVHIAHAPLPLAYHFGK